MRNNAFKSVETHYKRFIDLELREPLQAYARCAIEDVRGTRRTAGGGIAEGVGEHRVAARGTDGGADESADESAKSASSMIPD